MRMFKYVVSILGSLLLLSSCATNPNKARKISSEVKNGETFGYQTIGVNKDKEIIIQDKQSANDELRLTKWNNNKLESDLKHEHLFLKKCRTDRANPILGGDGNMTPLPDVDGMKKSVEVKQQLGIDEGGKLSVVKREYLVERLKAEKEYNKSLLKMTKMVKTYRADCEQKMGIARVKVGLPATRYQAKGFFDGKGNWVQTQKGEKTLSDAIQIRDMKK